MTNGPGCQLDRGIPSAGVRRNGCWTPQPKNGADNNNISSATMIVLAGGDIWLNPFATVLFNVCSAVTVKCCVWYVFCYVKKEDILQCLSYFVGIFFTLFCCSLDLSCGDYNVISLYFLLMDLLVSCV